MKLIFNKLIVIRKRIFYSYNTHTIAYINEKKKKILNFFISLVQIKMWFDRNPEF